MATYSWNNPYFCVMFVQRNSIKKERKRKKKKEKERKRKEKKGKERKRKEKKGKENGIRTTKIWI